MISRGRSGVSFFYVPDLGMPVNIAEELETELVLGSLRLAKAGRIPGAAGMERLVETGNDAVFVDASVIDKWDDGTIYSALREKWARLTMHAGRDLKPQAWGHFVETLHSHRVIAM